MRWILFALLLFEPIIIDEAVYNAMMQSAHQNMRGMEYDMLVNLFNQLEQQAVKKKLEAQQDKPKDFSHKP